jgi:16S rRNA (cytidine1402-2'-O)-methyltransferase
VTSKLLKRYEIKKPLISYHQRSKNNKTNQIIEKLKEGNDLALVTDAGTPGISDPGNELVAEIRREFKSGIENKDMEIVPIPGASAVATLASVAGINLQKFIFLGFPPNKKGRQTFFKEVVRNIEESNYPVFYYDSPYRVIKNLEMLQEMTVNVKVIIGRELTKKFEEIKVGSVNEILEYYSEEGDGLVKGEFVVLVEGLKAKV